MVDRMQYNPRRSRGTTFHSAVLTRMACALLLTFSASTVHAQSLRSYTLSGRPERVVPRPAAPLQLERYQSALNLDASLASLAPVRVTVPPTSRHTYAAPAQVVVSKARALECPMPVVRTDSSRSSEMPVTRPDSNKTRLDIGGTIVGCTNPLAR